jgi:hypothetical protein
VSPSITLNGSVYRKSSWLCKFIMAHGPSFTLFNFSWNNPLKEEFQHINLTFPQKSLSEKLNATQDQNMYVLLCDGKFRHKHRFCGPISADDKFLRWFCVDDGIFRHIRVYMFWSCITLGFCNSEVPFSHF